MSDPLDPEVVKEYVALQARTKCRQCKATEWALKADRGEARGGDRVGVFAVLGRRDEVVAVLTFECKGCGAAFARPAYTRAQLAAQQFPAVQLDARAETGASDPPGRAPGSKNQRNGNGTH